MNWLLAAACALASVPSGLRWLRVAQREHYLPGEVGKARRRWVSVSFANKILEALVGVGLIGTLIDPRWGFLVAIAQVGPIGLSIRGVTSPLAWTGRLRRLAITTGVVVVVFYVLGGWFGVPFLIVLPLALLPSVIDLVLVFLDSYEKREGQQWVDKAAAKLDAVGSKVVAITGSYGKTSTKNYLAHLIGGSLRVVASPASFNNRMGLARAINENLTPGTEVFIAEMGTYGPGEIAELCEWIPPDVAAFVAIGPVHLERFGTIENIVRSKAEIFEKAEVGVINVDYPVLAQAAYQLRDQLEIVEVSAKDVDAPDDVFGANLAVALGIGEALGVDRSEMLSKVETLPATEHRQTILASASGFKIVDDTFNSNPDGARRALEVLQEVGAGGRKVVVTPGMVELGPLQADENERFAREAAAVADDIIVVGRTNRKALLAGSANGPASVTVVASRDEAVEWVGNNLGPGDAVLYENDLPDHYP